MVEVAVDVDFEELDGFFENKAETIVGAIRQQMTAETGELLSYVKDTKLTGQYLQQRTGNLINSGFMEVSDDGGGILGEVSFGKTAPYARALHDGATIQIPAVDGKLMVFQAGGQTVFTRKHRAFTVTLPARPFLTDALEERSEEIIASLQNAAKEAAAE